MAANIWTIGHSTRSIEEFLELLSAAEIEAVADVRRYPGSRRWPQFSSERLAETLSGRGLAYLWLPDLGGRRTPLANSPNTAWRSESFRGYADYMATEPFARGLSALISLGLGLRTAIMCAEAVWWRCHRGLIADALRLQGFEVMHILGPGSMSPHPWTAAARVVDGRLTYQAPTEYDLFDPEPE